MFRNVCTRSHVLVSLVFLVFSPPNLAFPCLSPSQPSLASLSACHLLVFRHFPQPSSPLIASPQAFRPSILSPAAAFPDLSQRIQHPRLPHIAFPILSFPYYCPLFPKFKSQLSFPSPAHMPPLRCPGIIGGCTILYQTTEGTQRSFLPLFVFFFLTRGWTSGK